jgi:hypothetical protein
MREGRMAGTSSDAVMFEFARFGLCGGVKGINNALFMNPIAMMPGQLQMR